MKLEVGMYVRLKANNVTYIRQIVEICEDIRYATYRVDKPFCNQTGLSPKKILKSSYDILDLIDLGDYVNGLEVIGKDSDGRLYFDNLVWNNYENMYQQKMIESKDIKSIVTKEQFTQMEYKIG